MKRKIYYRKGNYKNKECDYCNKQGDMKYKVIRVIEGDGLGNNISYISGVNISESYYCSLKCMKEWEGEGEYYKVRGNIVDFCREKGLPL